MASKGWLGSYNLLAGGLHSHESKETHEKEKQFQINKRQVRYLEAVAEGAIPNPSADDLNELQAFKAEEQRREHNYHRRHDGLARRLASPAFPNFAGVPFYTNTPSAALYNACKRLKMKVEENYMKAGVLVVQDDRTAWLRFQTMYSHRHPTCASGFHGLTLANRVSNNSLEKLSGGILFS